MRDTLQVWIVTAAALFGAGGCSTITEKLANRITCTVAQDKAYIVSLWGFFGIASEADARDKTRICSGVNETKESK